MTVKILALTIILFSSVVLLTNEKQNQGFQLHDTNSQGTQQWLPKNNKKTRNNSEKQKFQLRGFFQSVLDTFVQIQTVALNIFQYLILRKSKSLQKTSVIYRQNFASQNGGAQILMISSSKIKSPKTILCNDPDAYLFTAHVLPITIVIGLQEQILIDSFAIQSGEVYSCITQDFMLQGAFSLQHQEWNLLGNLTADYHFQKQQFAVEQKIVRYLRLTILSSYGNWKYFTLSQIKVYGQGLFSHAMQNLIQSQQNTMNNQSTSQSTQAHNKKNLSKQGLVNQFLTQQHQTKEILVQAFQQLVVQGKQIVTNQKSKANARKNKKLKVSNQHNVQSPHLQTDHQNLPNEKQSAKQKKSISNLKKKISYLQKRNFEIHLDLKQLKKTMSDKIFQLQVRNDHTNQNHISQGKWHISIFDVQNIVIISLFINFFCLMLVWMVFKNKSYPHIAHSVDKIQEDKEKAQVKNKKSQQKLIQKKKKHA